MSSSQFVSPHEELICSVTVGVSLKNGVLVHVQKEVPAEQVSSGLVPQHCALDVMLDNKYNTLRTGDADLRFYITTVQDG